MQPAREARADCMAETPALCCVRLVLSFAATHCRCRRSRLCSLHDVPVACYHALLDEDIWVEPPPFLPPPPSPPLAEKGGRRARVCVAIEESTVRNSASRAAVPGGV